MTRINASIPPAILCDKHLMAEYFELPRVVTYVKKFYPRKEDIPAEFTLGRGHVKFFADKVMFLTKRYCALYEELVKRGYEVDEGKFNFNYGNMLTVKANYFNNWEPTAESHLELVERLYIRSYSINGVWPPEYKNKMLNTEIFKA